MDGSGGKIHRVVVTGMGLVTSLGLEIDRVWDGLLAGRSGVGPIPYFDASDYATRFAACVKDFDVSLCIDARDVKRMDRFTQFAVAAAHKSVRHAGLDLSRSDPDRIGVEIGSAVGGLGRIQDQSIVLTEKGPRKVNSIFVPMILVNMPACQVSIQLGLKDPISS